MQICIACCCYDSYRIFSALGFYTFLVFQYCSCFNFSFMDILSEIYVRMHVNMDIFLRCSKCLGKRILLSAARTAISKLHQHLHFIYSSLRRMFRAHLFSFKVKMYYKYDTRSLLFINNGRIGICGDVLYCAETRSDNFADATRRCVPYKVFAH